MLPFCGYNMGDYFVYRPFGGAAKLPRIYFVNWFRRDESGKFPRASVRTAVSEWIIERLSGERPGTRQPDRQYPETGCP